MGLKQDSFRDLLEDLGWQTPQYKDIAEKIVTSMEGRYNREHILQALTLWYYYSNDNKPTVRKTDAYVAAIEYYIAQMYEIPDITQTFLAEKYNVSAAIISQRFRQFVGFSIERMSELTERISDPSEDVFVPRSMLAEKHLWEISKMMANREFASLEEANGFIHNLLNQKNKRAEYRSLSKKEQAQMILYDAWEEPSASKRKYLIEKALRLDSDNPDAYNILAESMKTPEEAAHYYEQGMKAGERGLGQAFFEENKGNFWGLVSTRPYMRSKLGYAEMCLILGRMHEAVRHFEELLDLNPNDNQGVRYILLPLYLEMKNWRKAQGLLDLYNEDISANFAYNRILLEYGQYGVSSKLSLLLKGARKQNPYVIPYLLGKKRAPEKPPAYIGFGDESEAEEYIFHHIHLWVKSPGLLRWIASQMSKCP